MTPLLVLLLGLTSSLAEEFTTTATFNVKVGSTKKPANCDVKIAYTGSVTDEAASSIDCSCAWPKAKALGFTKTLSFTVGDSPADMFTAEITFKLTKAKNKGSGTMKTILKSLTATPLAADPEFYPASLWCPQEDYMVWGQGKFESIVNEAGADGWEQCAQRCSQFTNDAGNAPCFSWTINNNDATTLGLEAGTCRLLAYMNVSGVAVPGVQSGYHKCYNAWLTSVKP